MNDDRLGLAEVAGAAAETSSRETPWREMRVAISTPYYRETDEVLRACLESVRDQTHGACRHFVISDGHPNPLVDSFDVTHIRLPNAHGDNGDFARCVGALEAMAEDFDAIAFLDADNWFRPDHVARMVALQARTGAAVCTSGRSIHSLDGTLLTAEDRESDGEKFADTSCMCFFQPAFDLIALWGSMPRVAGPIGDRLLWGAVKLRGVSHAHDPAPTLAFRSQYAQHYRQVGKTPPKGAKTGRDLAKAWSEFRAIPYPERVGMFLGFGGPQALRVSETGQASKSTALSLRGSQRTISLELPADEDTRILQRDIFEFGRYRPVAELPPPRAILDVGANVGLAAAYFRLAYPGAVLVCVEPDPQAYALLARNAAIIGNCLSFCAALTQSMQTYPLFIGRSKRSGALASEGTQALPWLMMDAERFILDLSRHEFDLLKLDVGAAAIPILLSLKNRITKIAEILVEVQDDTDRRVVEALLSDTHLLWHGRIKSPRSSTLCYVLRSRLRRPAPSH